MREGGRRQEARGWMEEAGGKREEVGGRRKEGGGRREEEEGRQEGGGRPPPPCVAQSVGMPSALLHIYLPALNVFCTSVCLSLCRQSVVTAASL